MPLDSSVSTPVSITGTNKKVYGALAKRTSVTLYNGSDAETAFCLVGSGTASSSSWSFKLGPGKGYRLTGMEANEELNVAGSGALDLGVTAVVTP